MVVHGRPQTPKNTSFLRVTQPPGVVGDTTRPGHVTYVLVWSKSDRRRLRKTLHKQTNKQTDRHYENNGHLAVNQQLMLSVRCFDHHETGGDLEGARPCTDAEVQSANIGIHSAWRKANDRVLWRRIIDTATLH